MVLVFRAGVEGRDCVDSPAACIVETAGKGAPVGGVVVVRVERGPTFLLELVMVLLLRRRQKRQVERSGESTTARQPLGIYEGGDDGVVQDAELVEWLRER